MITRLNVGSICVRGSPTIGRMERVTGIGGIFFRANDPQALARWYAEHLGVDEVPTSYGGQAWETEAGVTVFAPFPADSDYFRRPEQQWAVNFRVRDLDAMVAQLRGADLEVEVHDTVYPNGRFAELVDPEGTPIQLWEPADPADPAEPAEAAEPAEPTEPGADPAHA